LLGDLKKQTGGPSKGGPDEVTGIDDASVGEREDGLGILGWQSRPDHR
jgi:hypothetical protein